MSWWYSEEKEARMKVECPYCEGTGRVRCDRCGGSGSEYDSIEEKERNCGSCWGRTTNVCGACNGTGKKQN